MGFFTQDKKVGGMLAGLGRLTMKSGTPTKDARRVVASFVRGENARGSCKKDSGCEIVATARELKVGDYVLAKRPMMTSSHLSVCVPDRAEMVQLKSGKSVEAQKSKDVRAAAGALLRAVGTGLGVRTDKAGIRRLVGAHGKRAAEVPGACIVVKLNKKQSAFAAAGLEASQEAISTYTTPFPTSKQVATVRALQLKVKRQEALARARAKKLSKRLDAAATAESRAAAKARFAKSGRKGWVAEAAEKKSKKRRAKK